MKVLKVCKIVALCALTATMASSCGGKKCIITGTVEGLDDIENLSIIVGENHTHIDTIAVTDGKFEYECPVDPTTMLRFSTLFDGMLRSTMKIAQIIPDSPAISVTLAEESKVEGSPLTTSLNELMTKIRNAQTEEEYYDIAKSAFLDNPDNAIGVAMFGSIVYDITLDEYDEYMEKACDKIKNDEGFAQIREAKVNAAKTAEGSEFVDFSGETPEGKPAKLSDYVGKGKYTLVDFWASWCGPCMMSMTGMANLWNEYHEKGLDIVGVAVWDGDNTRSRIKIEEKGMVWPQIFVGEDKTPTEVYGIVGIPHVILFDPEGIVIQRGIPDEAQLAEKIGDLLK